MHEAARSNFTDRQARAIIVAAEAEGFEREPELFGRWYDSTLHEDAIAAAEHLRAARRGFQPPEDDLPLMESLQEWNRGRAALAFLWDAHPEDLREFGEAVWVAPLPESAQDFCRHCVRGSVAHRFAGPLPAESDGRDRHGYM